MAHLGAKLRFAFVTLAGALLLAGCELPFGAIPASEPTQRQADPQETGREGESGVLRGLFTRRPVDLPDAVAIPDVRAAVVEPSPSGVILRVTGVAPTQGFFDATLVPANEGRPDAAGLVTVAFVAVPPLEPQQVGPERTRILTTAAFVTNLELRDVRGFRLTAGPRVETLLVPRP